MSHADVKAAVSEHVPCCHMEWPNDSTPPVPYACYLLDYDQPIAAGDVQIAVKRRWMVELYEKRRDKALETALGDELRAAFGAVRRDEQWIENDNLLQVVYTFYQIEGEFDG
jgi:hypothetical protein